MLLQSRCTGLTRLRLGVLTRLDVCSHVFPPLSSLSTPSLTAASSPLPTRTRALPRAAPTRGLSLFLSIYLSFPRSFVHLRVHWRARMSVRACVRARVLKCNSSWLQPSQSSVGDRRTDSFRRFVVSSFRERSESCFKVSKSFVPLLTRRTPLGVCVCVCVFLCARALYTTHNTVYFF